MSSRLLDDGEICEMGIRKKVKTEYLDEEYRKVSNITIFDCDGNDKLRINKYIWPLNDLFLMTSNLLIQTKNDQDLWNELARSNKVGYQYVKRTDKVKKWYEPKLRGIINVLIVGFLRKHKGLRIGFGLIQLVQTQIDASIVIFRELYVEYDPKPQLKEPPIDAVVAGYMNNNNDGIYIIGIHKLVQKYIDKVPAMYLEWDRSCSFFSDSGEYLCGQDLYGEFEWGEDLFSNPNDLYGDSKCNEDLLLDKFIDPNNIEYEMAKRIDLDYDMCDIH